MPVKKPESAKKTVSVKEPTPVKPPLSAGRSVTGRELTRVDMQMIKETKDFRKYKATLETFDDRAMKIVADSKLEMTARKKLAFLTENLEFTLKETEKIKPNPTNDLSGRGRCPPGTTFDPDTGTCV